MSEPCWNEDYPVPRPDEHRSARRQFLQFLGLGGLVVALGSFAKKLFAKDTPKYPELDVVARDQIQHGYHLFRYPTENDPAILVELSDGTLRAYSQRCTHLLCPVHFKAENQSLHCPCHNGSFDAKDGTVNYGPPPKPLPQFELEVRGGRVWITGNKKEQNGN
ncbi:MAG: Rieske (2Fe-2S) protein [Verrucomicrobia subdivision 3 bacterium]|nr:Rieske (2Fe-2S) protein [Limisphaerales bacterium]